MTDRDHITVVNAYGDVVEGATAKNIKVGGGYSRNTLVDIRAPGYVRRRISPTRKGVVMLTMSPETAIGPGLETAALKNFVAAARAAHFAGSRLRDFLGTSLALKQDRGYFSLPDGGRLDMDKFLDRTGAWRRVSGGLHEPHEEGFEIVGSWKTTRGAPDLQVMLWRRPMLLDGRDGRPGPILRSESYVAELDLDLRTGRGHVFEVARNHMTGGKTHPYLANQALSWAWGIVSFRLEAGK